MTHNDMVEELVSIILMQEREINNLKKKIARIKQYLEVYEDYIRREDY